LEDEKRKECPMSEKGSANVQPRNAASHTNLSTPRYGGNKEFNRWWDYWMSKVPDSRVSAQSKQRIAVNKTTYSNELDDAIDEKDAA
jgi:hypothetical protein